MQFELRPTTDERGFCRVVPRSLVYSLCLAFFGLLAPLTARAGYWTTVTNLAPGGVGVNLMLLLPDGTVMAGENANVNPTYNNWYRLSPDTNGSYGNGTWTTLSPMNYTRKFYSSQVLSNGKVLVAGGEYGTGGPTAELYDVVANQWSVINPPSYLIEPSTNIFADSESVVMNDGTVLINPVDPAYSGSTLVYNPAANSWSLGSSPKESVDEASWVKLADGTIITIDSIETLSNGVSFNGFGTNSERFIPALSQWVKDANVPVQVYATLPAYFGETGPGLLLPNGKAFFLGGTGHTVIYTPSGTQASGSWMPGPDLPNGLVSADAPAAMMPNGKILCAAAPPPIDTNGNLTFPPPTTFYEYDYTDLSHGTYGSFKAVSGFSDNETSYVGAMLVLPDGTVLYSHMATDLYIYHPDAPTGTLGKPVINSLSGNADGSFTLTGAGLNGICSGAAYGDDVQMDSSYPLVRISSAGRVYYARTFNWSTNAVMTGTNIVSTQFVLPSTLPAQSTLVVVANGIASDPVAFNPLYVAFSPLTNEEVVFDFSQIGGTITEPATVSFRVEDYDTSGNNDRYWNGSVWIANGNDPSVYLAATVNGHNWAPASGVNLPSRGQTPNVFYFLDVYAVDSAGNTASSEILLNRSPTDTNTPTLTLDTIHNGDVITNDQLPALEGSAIEYPSGIASVGIYLVQYSTNGLLYWNGASWSSTAAELETAYDAQTVAWYYPGALPIGSTLPNGNYLVQVVADDNEVPTGSATLSVNFTVDYHPTFTFNYGSGLSESPDNDWNDPRNWDTGIVPTADAHVIINGHTVTATGLGELQAYQLDLGNGSTLAADSVSVHQLDISSGTLTASPITILTGGLFNWSGGIISGDLTVPSAANLNISGADDKQFYIGAIIYLDGHTTWTGTGNIVGGYGVELYNLGTFSIQGDAQFANNTGGTAPVFDNIGTLQKTNADGTAIFSAGNGGWLLKNEGVMDVETGIISSQAQFESDAGASYAGAGTTSIDAGTGTLNGTGTLRPGSTLAFAGGNLDGAGTMGGSGQFVWSGGVVVGSLTLQSNANLIIEGAQKTLNGSIVNAGNCVWTDDSEIIAAYASVFENDGSFTAIADGTYFNYTGGTPLPLFINKGSFTKTNSPGTTDFDPANGGVAFNNTGVVNVQSGVLGLGGGGTSQNGIFNAAGGTRIDLTGGTHTFVSGLTFEGLGLTRVTNGIVQFLNGTNLLTNNGTFEIASGRVEGTNDFDGLGTANWSGGTTGAVLNFESNVNFNIAGANDKTFEQNSTMNLGGNSTWSGTGRVLIAWGCAITNTAGFVAQSDAQFYNYTGGGPLPVFVNNGAFTKTNSPGTTDLDPANGGVAFNNNGFVNVQSGVLGLGGGGTSQNGTFHAAGGTRIDLTGGTHNFGPGLKFEGTGLTRVTNASVQFLNGASLMTNNGTFEIASGTVGGANDFGGSGVVNWSGGTISAVLDCESNVAFNIFGTADKTFDHDGTIGLAGNSTWSGTGQVRIAWGCAITNTGSFVAQSDAQFYNYTGGAPVPVFVNKGLFTKTNSAGATVLNSANGGVAFDNNGIVSIQSGSLSLGGGGSAGNNQFNAAAGSWIDFNSGTFSFNGATGCGGSGTNLVSNGALTFNNVTNTMAGGFFEVDGGSIAGTNLFAGTGVFDWTGGTVSGAFNLGSRVPLNIYSSHVKTFAGGSLAVAGNTLWTDSGNINTSDSSAFTNNGTFTAQNSAQFFNYTGGAPAPVFVNNGAFVKSGVNTTNTFSHVNGGTLFNNNGDVNVPSGVLDIDSGGSGFNGTYNASLGAEIDLTGGVLSNTGPLVISGAGVTRVNGATFTQTGATTLAGTLGIDAGSLNGVSTFAGSGVINWTGGNIGGNFVLPSTMTLNLSGANDKIFGTGATILSSAAATWTGSGNFYMADSSAFNNTGTFVAENDSQFFNYTGGATPIFDNTGTFRKTASFGTTAFAAANGGVNFINSGVLDLQSGTLAVNAGYTTAGSSTLKLSIAGPSAGTQFGVESYGNPGAFNGTLAVSLLNGYMPTNGQSFVVANYPSASGEFSVKQLPALAYNSAWSVNYGPGTLTLQVVPQAVLSAGKLTFNGHFLVTLSGPAASSSVLWASTNLLNWAPIQTNTPFTGSYIFDDPSASAFRWRFYKAVNQP